MTPVFKSTCHWNEGWGGKGDGMGEASWCDVWYKMMCV